MFILRFPPFQRRKQIVGLAALLLGAFLATSPLVQASSVPTAKAPTPVWTEDFSSGTPSTTPLSLTAYTGGADALHSTYDAALDWLPGFNACNGWILNSTTPAPPISGANGDAGCSGANGGGGRIVTNGTANMGANSTRPAWLYLQRMAYQLGVAQDITPPAGNNALASMTNGNKNQSAALQFETSLASAPIPVTPGHFYIGSAWFAEVHCQAEGAAASLGWTNSSESFTLLIPGSPSKQLVGGFTPCLPSMGDTIVDGTAQDRAGNFHVGHMLTPGWLAPAGSTTVGVQIANGTPQFSGNDVAIDTPQLLDATPTLYKSFNPNPTTSSDYTVVPNAGGEIVTLTFIIVNTTDNQEKDGWSFTDVLPTDPISGDQLKVTTPLNLSSSGCASLNVTGPSGIPAAGEATIEVSGSLPKGSATCTISVDVEATNAEDSYVNAPGTNITDLVGLVDPNTATLTVASLTLSKTATVTDVRGNVVPDVLEAGDIITYTFTVENSTANDITDLIIAENSFSGAGNNTTAITDNWNCGSLTSVPKGSSVSCTATYTVLQSDMAADSITNAATASSLIAGVSSQSSVTLLEDKPALTLTKTASTDLLAAGDDVTFYFLVRNTGNVNLSEVRIDETTFTGSGPLTSASVSCPFGDLGIGASMTCEADYIVTAADVAAGTITNVADAVGSVVGITAGAPHVLKSVNSNLSLVKLGASSSSIPTLDPRMLALLALLLGGVAAWSARRRVWE